MKFDKRLFSGVALAAALGGEAKAVHTPTPEATVEQRAHRVVDMSSAKLGPGIPGDYYTGEGFFAQDYISASDTQNGAKEMFQLTLQKSEEMEVTPDQIEIVQGLDGKMYLYYDMKTQPEDQKKIPVS